MYGLTTAVDYKVCGYSITGPLLFTDDRCHWQCCQATADDSYAAEGVRGGSRISLYDVRLP